MKKLTDGRQNGMFVGLLRGIAHTMVFVYRRFRTILILALIVEACAVWYNPVLLVQQGKAFGRYMEKKSYRVKYNVIKEAHGDTIANLWDCKQSLAKDAGAFKKAWADTMTIFGR